MEKFKIDKLLTNCERVKDHSSKFDNEWSKFLIENCDELIEISKFIDSVAYKYTFNERMPINGFVSSLKILTAYTDLLVDQIDKRNKIDLDLTKLFKLINSYARRNKVEYQHLVEEEWKKENKNSLIVYEDHYSTKEFYDQIQ